MNSHPSRHTHRPTPTANSNLSANAFGSEFPNNESFGPPRYINLKNFVERLAATILMVPAIPVIFVLGCLVRLTSRGPAIYSQTRVGLNGKEFSMLKLRSMRIDAEADTGPKWSTEADPRVTPVGRVLRFLHLDELPQLWNVVKGEMAIIGPRPERPDFVNILRRTVNHYEDRHKVKPGITGLAQIYLPPDQTLDCVRKKICFDRAYIQSMNPIVDFQIWLCTVVRILGLRKGKGPKWFGLDRRYADEICRCKEIEAESNVPESQFHDETEQDGPHQAAPQQEMCSQAAEETSVHATIPANLMSERFANVAGDNMPNHPK